MNELTEIQNTILQSGNENGTESIELYPGIELCCLSLTSDNLTIHHPALEHILEINYCRSGRIGWEMGNGNSIYLGQNDFSIHTLKTCADSSITLPNGTYNGLTISIDLNTFTSNPPQILAGTGITGDFLYNKFCKKTPITSIAGNEQSERIFSGFYTKSKELSFPYQRIKVLELLLYLSELNVDTESRLTEYQAEQIEVIREIHNQLTVHIGQRFTIEELSKQYLMNPTTLKSIFKSVYGNSIAAHIKEHRMEEAAKLLLSTNLSIAEIAERVGYDSQSRFTAAFKKYSGMLPKDYRNN